MAMSRTRVYGKPVPLTVKSLLVLAAFAVFLFGGMATGIVLFLEHTTRPSEDQARLTERLAARVVESRDLGSQWGVIYSYRADGTMFYDQVHMDSGDWRPGSGVSVCVDPAHPEIHAVEHGTGCGVHRLYTGTTVAARTKPSL